MDPRFKLVIASDVDYEELVGELYFDDQVVCLVTREEGPTNMKLQIFPPKDGSSWIFPLADLTQALSHLQRELQYDASDPG
jgi:hypothetical protein